MVWEQVIDALMAFGIRTPKAADVPSEHSVAVAIERANYWRDYGMNPPHEVKATGDGGIMFFWLRGGKKFTSVEVDDLGGVVRSNYNDGVLVSSEKW